MNSNIESIKSAIYTYKQQREYAREQVKAITETYGQEAGDRERERQEKKLAPSREIAEQAIKTAYSNGVYAVNQWSKLDGAKLTDDAKLLDADLVDKDTFDQMKAKYANNATMLQALRRYGEKKNEADKQERAKTGELALAEPYNVSDIPTAENKLNNWEAAQKQAFHMLDVIDKDGQDSGDWGTAFEMAAMPKQLEYFGEGRDF